VPTINVFYADDQRRKQLNEAIQPLKEFVAKELTCGDIQLQPHEVSARLLKTEGDGMLAELELEVTAHAFDDRVKRQDEICLNIREFLKSKIDAQEIRVWLILAELGHSWE
jgi:ribosomal protein L31E